MGGQCHTPAAFRLGKTPGTQCTGGWVGSPGRTGKLWKISSPTRIRSPQRPGRSESLYRPSYPGPRRYIEHNDKCQKPHDREVCSQTYTDAKRRGLTSFQIMMQAAVSRDRRNESSGRRQPANISRMNFLLSEISVRGPLYKADGFSGLVVSILATGTRVRRWIFRVSGKSSVRLPSERK